MSIRSDKWSRFFYRLSVRLVRDVHYPSIGIAIARFLSDPNARLIDCLADAMVLLIFVISCACMGFILSWVLAEDE